MMICHPPEEQKTNPSIRCELEQDEPQEPQLPLEAELLDEPQQPLELELLPQPP